jgi:hypothetical protein
MIPKLIEKVWSPLLYFVGEYPFHSDSIGMPPSLDSWAGRATAAMDATIANTDMRNSFSGINVSLAGVTISHASSSSNVAFYVLQHAS